MKLRLSFLVAVLILVTETSAEIEKIAIPSDTGFRLLWWPRVTVADGWHHDRQSSTYNAANMIVPNGEAFADAETVIYAKAIFRNDERQYQTLDELIASDRAEFTARDPGIRISKADPLPIADETLFESLTYSPSDQGNWERVTYGEDGDFFLIFVVSSHTKSGFAGAQTAYEKMVKSYTREP